VIAAALLAGLLAVLFYLWHAHRARQQAADRLGDLIGTFEPETREEQLQRRVRPFPTRYRYLPPGLGCGIAALLWLFAKLPIEVAMAAGILLGVITFLIENHVAEERAARIEMQLAEAIDLLVGSLRAGASLLAAFESALEEADPPLKPYLQEVAGRIRLGDDPKVAVSELPERVPLETFRLFATSLAIHWEVGGTLSVTLATVGRTVRDRIELARRVRAQAVEANASVAVVLVLAYLLGILMWRTNPDRLQAFLGTAIGSYLVAGVMTLQAVGLVWMSRLSRPDF
jgi:tight adherence protein B